MTEGWSGLDLEGDAIAKLKESNEAKAKEIASQFHACFRTDPGQFVLKRLQEVTIDRPVLNAHSTQFGAGIREGQNQIVRQILDQIQFAEQQD